MMHPEGPPKQQIESVSVALLGEGSLRLSRIDGRSIQFTLTPDEAKLARGALRLLVHPEQNGDTHISASSLGVQIRGTLLRVSKLDVSFRVDLGATPERLALREELRLFIEEPLREEHNPKLQAYCFYRSLGRRPAEIGELFVTRSRYEQLVRDVLAENRQLDVPIREQMEKLLGPELVGAALERATSILALWLEREAARACSFGAAIEAPWVVGDWIGAGSGATELTEEERGEVRDVLRRYRIVVSSQAVVAKLVAMICEAVDRGMSLGDAISTGLDELGNTACSAESGIRYWKILTLERDGVGEGGLKSCVEIEGEVVSQPENSDIHRLGQLSYLGSATQLDYDILARIPPRELFDLWRATLIDELTEGLEGGSDYRENVDVPDIRDFLPGVSAPHVEASSRRYQRAMDEQNLEDPATMREIAEILWHEYRSSGIGKEQFLAEIQQKLAVRESNLAHVPSDPEQKATVAKYRYFVRCVERFPPL